MFKVNDVIIYGAQGVCRIADIEEKTVSGAKKTYYVLKPIKDQGSTIYAPTDNAQVLKKIRRLLSEQEINSLIDAMPEEKTVWIADDHARKECYKNVLARGDHSDLIGMMKAIYAHKKDREAIGKRLHMSDEHFFKEAEQMLYAEFQYVLKLSTKEELIQYILNRIS